MRDVPSIIVALGCEGIHEVLYCSLLLGLITLLLFLIRFLSIVVDSIIIIIIFRPCIAAALRLPNEPSLHLLELSLPLGIALAEVGFSSVPLAPSAVAAPVFHATAIGYSLDLGLQFDFEGHIPHVVVSASNHEPTSRFYVFNRPIVALRDALGLLEGLDADVAEAAALGAIHDNPASNALLDAELLFLTLSVATSQVSAFLVRGDYFFDYGRITRLIRIGGVTVRAALTWGLS